MIFVDAGQRTVEIMDTDGDWKTLSSLCTMALNHMVYSKSPYTKKDLKEVTTMAMFIVRSMSEIKGRPEVESDIEL